LLRRPWQLAAALEDTQEKKETAGSLDYHFQKEGEDYWLACENRPASKKSEKRPWHAVSHLEK